MSGGISGRKVHAVIEIKSYGKSELARMYQVHYNTFASWLKPFEDRLFALGYKKDNKVFTPAQVKFLLSDDGLGEPPSR